MVIKILIAIALVVIPTSGWAQKCVSAGGKSKESTRWGGNELIEIRHTITRRAITGFVEDVNEIRIPGALVEIFEVPKGTEKLTDRSSGRKRFDACLSDGSGRFRIVGLTKNAYEVRLSFGIGFNVTHMLLEIDKKADRQVFALIITAQPGT